MRQSHPHSKGIEPKKKPSLMKAIKPYKYLIIGLLVFALLSNGVNLVIPKLIARAIDDFSKGHFSYQKVVWEFLGVSLIIFVFSFFQGILQTIASEKVARDLRASIIEKISRQRYAFIQQANPSKLLTNLTSDVDSVKMFVSTAIVSLVSSVFIIVGASVLLLSIDWRLATAVLMIIPLIGGAFFLVMKKVRMLFKQNRELIDRLNKIINESILGAALIRVLNAQTVEYEKFLDANTQSRNIGIAILRLFALLIPMVVFIGNLATLIILALGGHYVIQGTMSLGNFAAFNSYLALLIFPIIVIGFISNFIVQASVSYGRIEQVLHAEETASQGQITAHLKGNIALNDVYVCYGDHPVIKHISFTIRAGEKTAVIGPTAAGKTQLVYLLTGLIDPIQGTIRFDGIDQKSFDPLSLQHQISAVFQDSVLFNMTLRENIAFNAAITEESMMKAVETAELNDFIRRLPQGLDTVVSERGTDLSGGQKQRIMLARALAMNPVILLLDDFTARVDMHTERKILENISNNYPDLTLIVVSQKIAPIRHFDHIILLEEGELLAEGVHDALMKSSPEYVQLFNSQKSIQTYDTSSIRS
ncbi:MAG: ABC transporter ATP-binding protein [Microbacter sp.]